MNRPPMLPVLIGVGTVILGCVNVLIFGSLAFVLALALWELPADVSRVRWGCFALIPALSVLLIPAGFGILMHRDWGLKIASAATFGIVIVTTLGTGIDLLLDDRWHVFTFTVYELVIAFLWCFVLKFSGFGAAMKHDRVDAASQSPDVGCDR